MSISADMRFAWIPSVQSSCLWGYRAEGLHCANEIWSALPHIASSDNDEIKEVKLPQPSQAEEVFRATAARIRVFRAFTLTLSPSRKSMARLTLPSRLEFKRLEGSSNEAPLANVIFTTLL